MYSQLGNIVFEGRRGFSSFSSSKETNFAEHALIENKPKLQRVGQMLDSIEVSIFLDQSFCVPQDEIDKVEFSREQGEILPLIMGDGRFVGDFVIKAIKVNPMQDSDNGRLLQAEVTLSLLEYFDADREATAQNSAIGAAFANPDNNPSIFVPQALAQTQEAVAAAAVVGANAAATTSGGILQEIGYVEASYRPKAEVVIQKMLKVGDDLAEVLGIINADPVSELYEVTRDLAVNIEIMTILSNDVRLECEALISDIDNANTLEIPSKIVSLTGKGTEVMSQANNLTSSAASLTALVVTQ